MPTRSADAQWKGNLKEGSGTVKTETGAVDGAYSFPSRFQEGKGTNPEELLGASHAACYSMALSNMLAEAGHTPESVSTTAKVHLDMKDGPKISKIELHTEGKVPGIDDATFQEHAKKAKEGCPISQALEAVDISLDAKLL